jgi:hypothetical protein
LAMIISKAKSGGASTPLMRAVQSKAEMGLISFHSPFLLWHKYIGPQPS